MSVVSDTSPLNYIVLIDLQHILPALFERILIPVAVRDELQSAGAPEAIARFMAAGQAWLEIHQVSWQGYFSSSGCPSLLSGKPVKAERPLMNSGVAKKSTTSCQNLQS